MPDNPSIHFIAFALFLIGFILFIAGLNIFKLEKITIHPGVKTWSIGLLLIVSSVFLFTKPDLFQPKTVASAPLDSGKNISGGASIAVATKINPQGEQAKESLKNYYDLLDDGNIDIAWNYLSSNIKSKLFKDASHTPVEEYKTWWQKDVHSIDLVSLKHVEGYPTPTDSKIEARLVYILKGRVNCLDDHSIFHLKRNGVGWVMFDKNRVSERPKVRTCL